MNLLLGQTVDTTDGPFGEIVDIIVDAQEWTAAHLVVRPFDKPEHLRLVPFWLIDADGSRLVIGLTKSYAMRLEMVPLVGLVSIAADPMIETDADSPTSDQVRVEPIGGTTVVGNPVRSIDGDFVGRVCGFRVTNRHLDAVLIRCGELDLGPLCAVPMIDVDSIRRSRIDLYISRSRVAELAAPTSLNACGQRRRSFERDTIHDALRLTLHRRPSTWVSPQRWRRTV